MLPSPFTSSKLLYSSPSLLLLPSSSSPHPHKNPKTRSKFTIRSSSTSNPPPSIAQIASTSAIRRIAQKLRSLGYIEEEQEQQQLNNSTGHGSPGEIFLPPSQQLPQNRVGYTIDTSWTTPENPIPQPGSSTAIRKFQEHQKTLDKKREIKKEARAFAKLTAPKEEGPKEEAPTLAELTIPKDELKRLRTIGIRLLKKLKVGKPGITEGIVNGIHERWTRSEIVKIKCEDLSAFNMKRTQDILERKTGGLVIWRSGSVIILYRGANYKYPYFLMDSNTKDGTSHDKPSSESSTDYAADSSKHSNLVCSDGVGSGKESVVNNETCSSLVQGVGYPNKVRFQLPGEEQLADEGDRLLDGLGPRFTDWWGCDPLPVDADLLPAIVTGYRRPFRLLPYGLRPKLTNDEMTTLRRLGRTLPCHFALGRNKNLQGLAVSMVKVWEKCEVAKIAVKRGAQNTNTKMMAEELQELTGGTLLSRDPEWIVIYRGKDFLPPAVSAALEERKKHAQCGVEQWRNQSLYFDSVPRYGVMTKKPVFGDKLQQRNEQMNNEFASEQKKQEFVSEQGRTYFVSEQRRQEFVSEQRKQRKTRLINKFIGRTREKLSMVLEKKAEVEKLLQELEKAEEARKLESDKEGITKEERYMLRKVGLRMKPFLLIGRRGIFDGTVENMHLHWKYRELVKVIASERCIEDVVKAARTLEAESGGVLVAVERVRMGYAIIVYRGKNYQRPVDLRPKTLLNKKQALARSIEAQQRESLKLHVLRLTENVDRLKLQLVEDEKNTHTVHPKELEGPKKDLKSNDSCALVENPHSQKNVGSVRVANIQQLQNEATISVIDNAEATPSASNSVRSPLEHGKNKIKLADRDGVVKVPNVKVLARAGPLSNKDRLLLRKQALRMKKRPVLAVGRNNAVAGVARTIKTHFKKNPLAIVSMKGRAKGTSIQELVSELEKATGAVMISQEPNKVVLYRGWGEDKEDGINDKRNAIRTGGRDGSVSEVVSPQLLEAIRIECGLQSKQQEDIL